MRLAPRRGHQWFRSGLDWHIPDINTAVKSVGAEGRRTDLDVGVNDDVADDVLAGRQLLGLPPPQGAQVQRQPCADQAPSIC